MAKHALLRGELGAVLPEAVWRASLARYPGSALEADGLAAVERAYPDAEPEPSGPCPDCGRERAVMLRVDDRWICSRCWRDAGETKAKR